MTLGIARWWLTALAGVCASAQSAPAAPPATPAELLARAPDAHWRDVAAQQLLVMTLPQGRVLIELAPQFAPAHVANIQTLARQGYWDDLAILRAQDGYVVQWGDPGEDIPGEPRKPLGQARSHLPAEFSRPSSSLTFDPLPDADPWAAQVGFVGGFAAARDHRSGQGGSTWPVHCYGTVGAGRDNAPDSSTGAQLYAVIGPSPRALDRNITVVGRVLQGMEWLSTLRRGPPPMGFYTDPAQRTPIGSLRLASSLPPEQQPRLQVLRTDSPTFAALNQMRRERKDGWTVRAAGRLDVCSALPPLRPSAAPSSAPGR